MELRILRYFYTIAEEGNVSKAAEVLHITQPTLSRQLKALEDELGTALFIRQHNHLELTPAGMYLRSRAAEMLQLAQQTSMEFENRKRELFNGHVTIGCVEADNSDTLSMLLEDFTHDYPNVTFDIFSGTSDIIKERLDKGLLDMAILLEPVDTRKYSTVTLPRRERWGLLVPFSSPLARKGAIFPADLQPLPLLISGRPEIQQMLANWAQMPFSKLNVRGHFNLSFNVISLVAHGVADAVMIEGAITGRKPKEVSFVPLSPEIQTNCVLVWRRERVMSPVADKFISYFKTSFQN
ncbi:LysR family transcriptional regulator [Secundilactobacillus folii]|uniref:LysR family transcriptional regulator n=1 Tax=Secundilactobacillus folii TaxID=2678357 RepID=A0A7X2XU26_9LACO|nr:LysR family transcriptional regulator [Secundilactobacillus folii]MTV81545.1 LysR family transcriptional regulator [Secundilactobacillus folii]